MIVFGRGDAILHYPELIAGLNADDQGVLAELPRDYICVHPFGSERSKTIPSPEILFAGLTVAQVPFVVLGNEPCRAARWTLPPKFTLQVEALRRARKFIGSLSVFNCVAQVLRIPSFVLVNRALKDPDIYAAMERNSAVVAAWNIGKPLADVFAEAVEWARQ